MESAHVLLVHYLLCVAVWYILKIRDCRAKKEANCLPSSGCCSGSCRPSGESPQLLSVKEKLNQERLLQARLEGERRERICSISKGLETVKNKEQKYHSMLQSWWKKVFFTVQKRRIPLFFLKSPASLEGFCKTDLLLAAATSTQRQEDAA